MILIIPYLQKFTAALFSLERECSQDEDSTFLILVRRSYLWKLSLIENRKKQACSYIGLLPEKKLKMKRRLVLWGENAEEKKHLYAIDLQEENSKVDIYAFPLEEVTESFSQDMMGKWRNGEELTFPENHQTFERPLNLSETLLPEEVKVDRTDLVNRAQTEWNFVVMSGKLQQAYTSELEDIKMRIQRLEKYDNGIWEELKTYWNKVQTQIRDKNLFGEQATQLRKATDEAFDTMKELRKKMNDAFGEESAERKEKFIKSLKDIEEKVEKNLGLKPLFEELKSIQRDFNNTKFVQRHRQEVWNKLDGLFKVIKEKRFGDKASSDSSPKGRLERRYNGLQRAIQKMKSSIGRDESDLKFEKKRIERTDGQLELQMRQAKLKMIEERLKSKEIKLDDMLKTQKDLEGKIEREIEKQRQAEIAKEKQKAAEEAKKKIQAQMEAERKERSEEEEAKIQAAAERIQSDKRPTPAAAKEESQSQAPAKEEEAPAPAEKEEENKEESKEEHGSVATIEAAATVAALLEEE